jgi:hypothetical protein
MKKMFSSFKLLAIAVGGMVVFASCKKSFIEDTNNDPVANLMAFNLVPDKSAVTVVLSNNVLTNVPLAYTNFTGSYVRIYPGNRTVESFDNNGVGLAVDQAYGFQPQQYYSVFVAGNNGAYRNIIVHDDFDSLSTSSGEAYIRYINAIPDSARPNVSITAEGSPANTSQPAFGKVSDFIPVTAGNLVIDVNNGGTIDAERTIAVEARKVYTVLLVGVPGVAATPVEIKFITNGELEEDATERSSTSGRSVNMN